MPSKIAHSEPIPTKRRSKIGDTLVKMKIADHFDVEIDEITQRSHLYTFAARAGIKITIRTITNEETGEKFIRVWRVE